MVREPICQRGASTQRRKLPRNSLEQDVGIRILRVYTGRSLQHRPRPFYLWIFPGRGFISVTRRWNGADIYQWNYETSTRRCVRLHEITRIKARLVATPRDETLTGFSQSAVIPCDENVTSSEKWGQSSLAPSPVRSPPLSQQQKANWENKSLKSSPSPARTQL